MQLKIARHGLGIGRSIDITQNSCCIRVEKLSWVSYVLIIFTDTFIHNAPLLILTRHDLYARLMSLICRTHTGTTMIIAAVSNMVSVARTTLVRGGASADAGPDCRHGVRCLACLTVVTGDDCPLMLPCPPTGACCALNLRLTCAKKGAAANAPPLLSGRSVWYAPQLPVGLEGSIIL